MNVGMPAPTSFGNSQNEKVAELADIVMKWLVDVVPPAVVGLTNIHAVIASKLAVKLERRQLDVGIESRDSNSVLWRTRQ